MDVSWEPIPAGVDPGGSLRARRGRAGADPRHSDAYGGRLA